MYGKNIFLRIGIVDARTRLDQDAFLGVKDIEKD